VLRYALGATSTNQQKLISRYAQGIGYFAEQGIAPQDLSEAILEFPGGISGAASASAKRRRSARADSTVEKAVRHTEASTAQPAGELQRPSAATHSTGRVTDEVVVNASLELSKELRQLQRKYPQACLVLLVQVHGAKLNLLRTSAARLWTNRYKTKGSRKPIMHVHGTAAPAARRGGNGAQ
jgi:hypothetical protein